MQQIGARSSTLVMEEVGYTAANRGALVAVGRGHACVCILRPLVWIIRVSPVCGLHLAKSAVGGGGRPNSLLSPVAPAHESSRLLVWPASPASCLPVRGQPIWGKPAPPTSLLRELLRTRAAIGLTGDRTRQPAPAYLPPLELLTCCRFPIPGANRTT